MRAASASAPAAIGFPGTRIPEGVMPYQVGSLGLLSVALQNRGLRSRALKLSVMYVFHVSLAYAGQPN